MLCPTCHTENDDSLKACTACGQLLVPFPTLTVGTIVGGRYEIVSLLGKGGMGMVFKAKDRALDEIVALKILRPDVAGSGEMARRFRNEIKLARKVRHKNVCGIHEYNEEGALQYIAMEYVEGIDLKRLLRERNGLPADEAFDVALQLAHGLDAIHDVGIIHRDLKTANAMIDRNGVVRLMDFGIAKKFDSEGSLGATAVGHIIGTPEYMSPEQARGEKIDFRSDIYALGVMLFEIFTGRVPFQAETPIATIFKHLQEPPPLDGPAAAAIPPALVPVLACCLAKEPDERYSSAAAVVTALYEAQALTCPEAVSPGAAATHGLPRASRTPPSFPAVVSPTPAPHPSRPSRPAVTPEGVPTVLTPTPPSHPGARTPMPRPVAAPPATRLMTPTPTVADARGSGTRRSTAALLILGVLATIGVAAVVVIAGLWLLPAREPRPSADGSEQATGLATVAASPAPWAAASPATRSLPSPPPATPRASGLALASFTPVATPLMATPPRPTLRLSPYARATPYATPTPLPTPQATLAATAGLASSEEVAMLDVTTKPSAEVAIDGERRGQTPLRGLRLTPGSHAIVLTHPDFQPFRRKLNIPAGQRRSLDVDLTWEGVRK